MKKLLSALTIGSLILTTGHIHAQNANGEMNIYADCGIGALVWRESTSADKRTYAAISNIIWDWGTTASSSKSSGTCAGNPLYQEAAIFIHETQDNIVEDAAKGTGEHLTALLDILEFDKSSRETTISKVQNELFLALNQPNFSSKTKVEKSEIIFKIVTDLKETI